MLNIGYVYDELMLLHYGYKELENPERIIAIHNELLKREYLEKIVKVESKYITDNELLLAHDAQYIDKLAYIFSMPEEIINGYLGTMDSMFGNKNSLISASIAAGSTLNLMKEILNNNVRHGIAIVRSPGHHAFISKASGFCFYNNVAISAKYGIKCGKKIAIIDWDCHHGDGSEDILKNVNNCLFISIHRHDRGKFYPGTGKESYDNIVNVPINGTAYDNNFYDIFKNIVNPKLKSFNPDIIIVSAGFDAAEGDPLGRMHISPNCYYNLTKQLLMFDKPLMLVLEGGYNLMSISNSMAECTKALLENVGLL